METKKETKPTIVTIEGEDYIAFPEVVDFTHLERGTLQQRLNRDRKDKKFGIKRIKTKYIFVPLDVCEQWRSETVVDEETVEIKQILSEGLTMEDIREFAKLKLAEKKKIKK